MTIELIFKTTCGAEFSQKWDNKSAFDKRCKDIVINYLIATGFVLDEQIAHQIIMKLNWHYVFNNIKVIKLKIY